MKFIKELMVILSVSFVAEVLEYVIPLPVAASVYGLVLMLLLLKSGILRLNQVEGAADSLVEIMPILFVPPTVGIMACVDEMKQMLIPLCVISVVSTFLIMITTGKSAQFFIELGTKKKGEKK